MQCSTTMVRRRRRNKKKKRRISTHHQHIVTSSHRHIDTSTHLHIDRQNSTTSISYCRNNATRSNSWPRRIGISHGGSSVPAKVEHWLCQYESFCLLHFGVTQNTCATNNVPQCTTMYHTNVPHTMHHTQCTTHNAPHTMYHNVSL